MGGKMPAFMVAAVLVFPVRPAARHGQEPPWLGVIAPFPSPMPPVAHVECL